MLVVDNILFTNYNVEIDLIDPIQLLTKTPQKQTINPPPHSPTRPPIQHPPTPHIHNITPYIPFIINRIKTNIKR